MGQPQLGKATDPRTSFVSPVPLQVCVIVFLWNLAWWMWLWGDPHCL